MPQPSVTKLKPENTEHITPHFSSSRNWPRSLYFSIQDLKPDSRDCQLTHHPSPNTRGKRAAGPLRMVGSGHQHQRQGPPGAERHAWLPNQVWTQWMLSGGVSWMSQDTHVHRLGFRECRCHLGLPSLPEYPSHPEPRTGSECLGWEGRWGDANSSLITSTHTGDL